MYNKSLDVFKAVAESSSFTKASEQLYISHTAVIKQMNQLETHLGVKLFHRTHNGIALTPAGQQLYQETLEIIKHSNQSVQRVQEAHFASPQVLRVGSSLLYPCYDFMEIWDKVNEQCPQFRLKIVSFTDEEKRLIHLHNDFDFLISPYNNNCMEEGLLFFLIGYYRFCLTMPKKHSLANKKELSFKDLKNQKLMIMKTGTSPINDQIRNDIKANYPDIMIEDIPPNYSLSTFNQCVEENAILLSLDCWQQVHPSLVSIRLQQEYLMPYGIILPKESKDKFSSFIKLLQNILIIEK